MPTSYVALPRQIGDEVPLRGVFFIPVIRQRLCSAILVQRALRELNEARTLDANRDVIAVALPDVLLTAHKSEIDGSQTGDPRSPIEEAIARLPKLSVLHTKTGEDDYREVFPVTPCDGFIEAVRSARELGLPLELVDQNITPGHLGLRNCTADPDWPDDELALVEGAEWYLDRIRPLLGHPPSRIEPIDSWREEYMAERVRDLHLAYERVIFVCEATNVTPIFARLRRSAPDREPELVPRLTINRADPSLGLQLHLLDDIPRLVEIYERERSAGRAWALTKQDALARAIRGLQQADPHIQPSIRNHEAFFVLLQRRLAFESRCSPNLDETLRLARTCFGMMFATRIRRYLLGYYDDIDPNRVGDRRSEPPPGMRGEALQRAGDSPTTSAPTAFERGCNPLSGWYVVESEGLLRPQGPAPYDIHHWPPYKEFVARMREKAFNVRAAPELKRRVTRFQGSIRNGLDPRRTLRSHLGPAPTLYVKELVRKFRLNEPLDTLNPVLWLFEPEELYTVDSDEFLTRVALGNDTSEAWTCMWSCYLQSSVVVEKFGKFDIQRAWLDCLLSFCAPNWTDAKLQASYGTELGQRIPRSRFRDATLNQLIGRLVPAAPWPAIFLEAAINFAKKEVILIAPISYTIPASVSALANQRQIKLTRLPIHKYTTEEIWKLRCVIRIAGPHDLDDSVDRNDRGWAHQIIERFGQVVSAHW